ncbi:MAG: hypothetical protein IT440_06400 [Phycisphaeraceae bacterium]|nr:hypothetical protein [Phycisphaeraceae bacterium]
MDDTWPDTEHPAVHDLKLEDQEPWEPEPSVTISTHLMHSRIQAVHCRLLERATLGRLTWEGDRIVPTGRATRPVPACQNAVLFASPELIRDDGMIPSANASDVRCLTTT